ncbi:hypothetical protein H6P81_021464 [Aristolochia fimbriata]|uniref:Uncharacterized protein n=1 Tax=Aristolochia fimbriata TaxID=158543 RepID=A0AAV7DPV0_ARIFI|nr:hypothetical protein H6P81_021464 [Aristolochia fimbriata]
MAPGLVCLLWRQTSPLWKPTRQTRPLWPLGPVDLGPVCAVLVIFGELAGLFCMRPAAWPDWPGSSLTPFAFARRRECLRFPWRVAWCPLASAPLSRSLPTSVAPAPALSWPQGRPGAQGGPLALMSPMGYWGERGCDSSAPVGNPARLKRFLFSLMCLGPGRAGPGGRRRSVRHGAESRWIVAARPLCHLQYPSAYLSRRKGFKSPPGLELCFRRPRRLVRPWRRPRLRCPWGGRPLMWNKQSGGEGGAGTSSESAVRAGEGPKGAFDPIPARRGDQLSPAGNASSSPRQPGGLGLGPRAQPSSQSFFRSYGSILPTSLAYIVPSTEAAWAALSVLRFFRAARGCRTPAACGALPARWTLPPAEPFSGSAPAAARPGAGARGLLAAARRPPTHRGLAVARLGGYGVAASAIHSGLVDSAGELLHTP